MHSNVLAIAFALSSALTIAWGTVVRHRIAEDAPADGSLKGSPFWNAISRPLWWAGTGTALLGYGLQVIALAFGTLLVVQPILVLSLMFTLPLSAYADGRRISRIEMRWAGLLTAAVAVLVVVGQPQAGNPHPPLERWVPALLVGAVVLIGLERLAQLQIRREKALLLGVVTGALFGYVAVLSKAVVDVFVHAGFWGLITNWETYGLIAGATLGTIVQQYSFNAGALKNSLPAMTITEPIVAFSLGYVVLGESFQVSSVLGWLAMGAALVVMIVSTIVLSSRGVH
ncbi:DMT family transporter [Corynebacterium uberis]|uniref:DMT family transporter n=1 Tax=Corynebacterium TaxID=1716 RepID=UPI001D0B8E65|nr:DMT family transporter [Corynebacterium uberis]MCZ9309922.1 DMT family transporter [Corynebacterium sp. c6VSa_13]UDL73157.1 DMT family transporter [Corynebacterium uberis]UDL75966.1 DMT family transporter [Corynebacterium uberis]UDL78178.1 DMT family transporter [Corynebacterium uberis]UDL80461.1 DMT family transporter [Corynebacterium uberis]